MDIASPTASKLYGAAVAASQPTPTDSPSCFVAFG